MPEEQIKARLVQAATMQQEAAAEKLKVRSQRVRRPELPLVCLDVPS